MAACCYGEPFDGGFLLLLLLEVLDGFCFFFVGWETVLDFGVQGVVAEFCGDETGDVGLDGGVDELFLEGEGAAGLGAEEEVGFDGFE